jgi:hypothetical protein
MDESFKPSFWSPRIWKNITPNIKNVYCDLKTNELYKERVLFYNQILSANKNDDIIKEYFSQLPKFDRNLEIIDDLCI